MNEFKLYYSNDIKTQDIQYYESTDEVNYKYFIINSKYNNDKKLQEG